MTTATVTPISLHTLVEAARPAAEASRTLTKIEDMTVAERREVHIAYGRALIPIRALYDSDKLYNAALKEHGLDVRDTAFRANALWLAENEAGLGPVLDQCPCTDPGRVRQWLRDQERPEPATQHEPQKDPVTYAQPATVTPIRGAQPHKPSAPVADRVRDQAAVMILAGVPRTEIAKQLGVSDTVLRVINAEVNAGAFDAPDTSTLTPKQKQTFDDKLKIARIRMEASVQAIHRNRMANIDEEVRQRVVADSAEHLANLNRMEAEHREQRDWYTHLINEHKSPLTRAQFMDLHLCLRGEASDEVRHRAGVMLNEKRGVLTGEKA